MQRQFAMRARERERRERERLEREYRERSYNQQLYNQVHNVSSATNQATQQQPLQPQPGASSPAQQRGQCNAEGEWEALRQTVLRQISLNDKDSASLVKYIYSNFPPKGKIRITDESIVQIGLLQRSVDPSSRKKLKMFLLKVIQDYHPDKVDEELGEKWKTISEDIVKRVTRYYEALK